MAGKKPTWADYLNSGFYKAADIGALQGQLSNYNLDQSALTQQAMAALQPGYNQSVLTANQQFEQLQAGYENQLSGLDQTYDMQRRALGAQYDQSGSQALNQLGKRGMGRSSLVGTTLGALESARGQALSDLSMKQADAYGDIRNNMTLAQRQHAATLQGYADNLSAQASANALGLYNANLQAQTALQAQISQIQQAGYQAYVDQMNKKTSSGSSRSSSGSSYNSSGGSTGGGSSSADKLAGAQADAAAVAARLKTGAGAVKSAASKISSSLSKIGSKIGSTNTTKTTNTTKYRNPIALQK